MLSLPHLVVIFLVALVVLGPEKLPEVARVMGKMMAEFRRVTGDFRNQIEGEMRDLERQARVRDTEDYQKTLAGAVPEPHPVPDPVLESIGSLAVPPAPAAAEHDAPSETPVPVPAHASEGPEKSPDGDSHSS